MIVNLHQGDCFHILEKISNNTIDMILTDIPYCISRENNFKTMKDRKNRNGIEFGDWDLSFDIRKLNSLIPLIKKGGSFFTFHAFEQYSDLLLVMKDLEIKDKLIWEKSNPMPRNRDRRYIANIEMASWFVKKGANWVFYRQSEKYDKSIFTYPSESGGGFIRYHPNQKNVSMMKEIIKRHTNEGDLILDPFMGSGTVGVACKELNRSFVGIEREHNYFQIAKKRIENENMDGLLF